jgi:hypothetical protein
MKERLREDDCIMAGWDQDVDGSGSDRCVALDESGSGGRCSSQMAAAAAAAADAVGSRLEKFWLCSLESKT